MPSKCSLVPGWLHAAVDVNAFDREQECLGQFWTLLGVSTDIPRDGDWFRSVLAGRSVFVQRFGDDLRAFENVCAHRFYPLRTQDQGNGPIRCGFHHWQYNKDGLAIGIPKCQEMFGVTPRELNARLKPVEIATCGILIFGRFPGRQESLEEYLGEGFPILQAMWSRETRPYRATAKIAANWKFGFHISLDDYHLVAVHPDTFGKFGYLPPKDVQYFRFGRHSAYFHGADADAFAAMANECRNGSYQPPDYRIFQFFPNLVALHFEAARNWFVLIQQYQPLAHDRTLLRSWYAPAPFAPRDRTGMDRFLRRAAAPWLPFIVPFYMRKITGEDNVVCERIQEVAQQIDSVPILSRHEERIGWFEEAYAEAMGE